MVCLCNGRKRRLEPSERRRERNHQVYLFSCSIFFVFIYFFVDFSWIYFSPLFFCFPSFLIYLASFPPPPVSSSISLLPVISFDQFTGEVSWIACGAELTLNRRCPELRHGRTQSTKLYRFSHDIYCTSGCCGCVAKQRRSMSYP